MELRDVAGARRDRSLVVLEGFHAVKHALRFGATLHGAWAADLAEVEALRADLAPDVDLRPEAVDRDALRAVVPRAQLVAVADRPRQAGADEVLAAPGPAPVVLLEGPRHLGNLGAAVRVAAAAGAAGVLTTGDLDPWHPDALRGSAGLHFALPVHRVRALDGGGRPLVALDPAGDPRAALPPRALLAFGTERGGLTARLLARADARVALPMRAGVSSLNLATAVAATLYRLPGA